MSPSEPVPEQRSLLSRLIAPITMVTGPWTQANGVSWVKLIIFILVLRWGCFELYSIPSGSMEPVLHGDARFFRGDRVAVNKALFGPRIPFTTIRIFPFAEPKRWDVVVFNAVDPEAEHPILIKRVVGLPGERIRIRNGQIFINGEAVDPPEELREILYYTSTITPPRDVVLVRILHLAKSMTSTARMDLEVYGAEIVERDLKRLKVALEPESLEDLASLSDERLDELTALISPLTFQMLGENFAREFGLATNMDYAVRGADEFSLIPEGHYLMLGDNSGNSADGRIFGWVPHENLYGRAFAVALPFGRMTDLTGFTGTVMGLLILLGLPCSIVFGEMFLSMWAFPWRVTEENSALGFRSGDRLWINRRVFGVSVPLLGKNVLLKRQPVEGETWAYLQHDDGGSAELRFGNFSGTIQDMYQVHAGDEQEEPPVTISSSSVVGRVRSVWWPLGRRRRFSATAR